MCLGVSQRVGLSLVGCIGMRAGCLFGLVQLGLKGGDARLGAGQRLIGAFAAGEFGQAAFQFGDARLRRIKRRGLFLAGLQARFERITIGLQRCQPLAQAGRFRLRFAHACLFGSDLLAQGDEFLGIDAAVFNHRTLRGHRLIQPGLQGGIACLQTGDAVFQRRDIDRRLIGQRLAVEFTAAARREHVVRGIAQPADEQQADHQPFDLIGSGEGQVAIEILTSNQDLPLLQQAPFGLAWLV